MLARLLLAIPLLLAACAAPGGARVDAQGLPVPVGTLAIPAGDYAAAFAAARDTLRDERYALDRQDILAGVITTRPDSRPGDAADLVNRHRRIVRVSFHSPSAPTTDPAPIPADGPLEMRVRVVVERLHRPLWRVETTSVKLSSTAIDPQLVKEGEQPEFAVAISDDPALAESLARLIERKWRQTPPPVAPGAPAPGSSESPAPPATKP